MLALGAMGEMWRLGVEFLLRDRYRAVATERAEPQEASACASPFAPET